MANLLWFGHASLYFDFISYIAGPPCAHARSYRLRMHAVRELEYMRQLCDADDNFAARSCR